MPQIQRDGAFKNRQIHLVHRHVLHQRTTRAVHQNVESAITRGGGVDGLLDRFILRDIGLIKYRVSTGGKNLLLRGTTQLGFDFRQRHLRAFARTRQRATTTICEKKSLP